MICAVCHLPTTTLHRNVFACLQAMAREIELLRAELREHTEDPCLICGARMREDGYCEREAEVMKKDE